MSRFSRFYGEYHVGLRPKTCISHAYNHNAMVLWYISAKECSPIACVEVSTRFLVMQNIEKSSMRSGVQPYVRKVTLAVDPAFPHATDHCTTVWR